MNTDELSSTPSLSVFRITKVKELEKTIKQLNERIRVLEKYCIQLKEENDSLRDYIEQDNTKSADPSQKIQKETHFETDEDELCEETDWIVQNHKKKVNKKSIKKTNKNVVKNKNPSEIVRKLVEKEPVETTVENKDLLNPSTPPNTVHFETDEDELCKETEWILQKNRKKANKKRKANSSPECFEISDQKEATIQKPEQNKIDIDRKPPPIVVTSIRDYQKFHLQLKKIIETPFTIKIIRSGTYKINTSDSNDYRNVTKALTESNTPWYSFEDKGSRPIKVMVKNLHHTCEVNSIVNDLQSQGLQAIEAFNKFKYKTNEPLNMFIVSFEASENIKKIYEIRSILNTLVSVEPIKHQKLIPQCKHCQGFGHTKNYCNKTPRCVKCAGKHKSIECNNEHMDHPKCCNCGKNHPSTYRGCVVAKELQKIRNKTMQKYNNTSKYKPEGEIKNFDKPNTSKKTNSSVKKPTLVKPNLSTDTEKASYANVSKGAKPPTTNETNALTLVLNQLIKSENLYKSIELRLEKLEEKFLNMH